jgi:hypothetical protein
MRCVDGIAAAEYRMEILQKACFDVSDPGAAPSRCDNARHMRISTMQSEQTVEREVGETPSLNEIADRLAIQEVLSMHSRGIDRLDQAAIEAAYWPEAEVAYGAFDGRAHDFAAMVVHALRAGYELTQHSVSNTLITFLGDRAKSESYVAAYHLLNGAEEEMFFSGRYLDAHEKRGDVWKMIHRRVVMDWSRQWAVVDERENAVFAGLAKGARIENDPLYPFLTPS